MRILVLILAAMVSSAQAQDLEHVRRLGTSFPNVEIETTAGTFVVELDARRAPLTVENFLAYVESGHYDGTIFHRVIPGFVAQAGGYTERYEEKETKKPVVNESGNGLSNKRGTIALARLNPPHTGTAQFFINLKDNTQLDPNPQRWGYCVFGMVVSGMDVVDAIAAVPTGAGGPFRSDVPQEAVVIKKARVMPREGS